jgi:hypothetical protein
MLAYCANGGVRVTRPIGRSAVNLQTGRHPVARHQEMEA